MKILSESKALEMLAGIRESHAAEIRTRYEHAAKSCETCETKGACCLDAHFVNVHITPLEARAIKNVLAKLPEERQQAVYQRVDETVRRFGLCGPGDTFARTYACPLFEKGTGCLVHDEAKPLPCIQHACYENEADMPPDAILNAREHEIGRLNTRTYGKPQACLPLPAAIS